MKRLALCLSIVAVAVLAVSARGIVLHPQGAEPGERPSDAVVVKAGGGSGVVVSPNWILTSVHQNVKVGTAVTFADGAACKVVDTRQVAARDCQLSRIVSADGSPANRAAWVGVAGYVAPMARVTLAGYGYVRGSTIKYDGQDVGYAWTRSSSSAPVWGSNVISSVYAATILIDFSPPTGSTATSSEASPAQADSGGPWFIQSGGRWLVVGLSEGTARSGQTWYAPVPDQAYAVNVCALADEIEAVVASDRPAVKGDVNGDGVVNAVDKMLFNQRLNGIATAFADGRYDLNGDGLVNAVDKLMMNRILNDAAAR